MLSFATEIAREAGNLLVQKLGSAKVTNKGDINLVTEADIAAENLIIERIIDIHVRRIRAKFREAGGDPIAMVHGVGYKAADH